MSKAIVKYKTETCRGTAPPGPYRVYRADRVSTPARPRRAIFDISDPWAPGLAEARDSLGPGGYVYAHPDDLQGLFIKLLETRPDLLKAVTGGEFTVAYSWEGCPIVPDTGAAPGRPVYAPANPYA